MSEIPIKEGEPVMSDAEFDLAQAQFMQTIGAAGWPGMNRDGFIIYIAMSYASSHGLTHPYGVEAIRLLVHFLHLRAGQTTIDRNIIHDAEVRLEVYQIDEIESEYEPDYGPEFI